MKLEMSRKTELALAAIRELRKHESPLKGADLAELLDTTATYIPHVLRPLVKRGWVESGRGPTGGYRLIEKPADITLYDFIEVVEGPMDEGRCVLRGKPCPSVDLCVLHEPWLRARDALFAELRRTTLADVPLGEEAA
jgi:Rrf2 family protein